MNFLRVSLLAFALTVSGAAVADCEIEDYSETITLFRGNETAGPLMGQAYAFAVFPTIGKGGIGIGGAGGKGQVYRGGSATGCTSLVDISVGFQLGGQAYSQIILLRDQEAYDKFTTGKFEFDASASAVALTASAQAETGTTGTGASAGTGSDTGGAQASADWVNGMIVFTIAKGGLMYEASIGGQKYGYKPVGE
jgi:lipid-binding SYLF domain-containing protein